MIARMALSWCPEQPYAERVARHILAQERRGWAYDLVDPEEVLRSLAAHVPGHRLTEVYAERAEVLENEVQRVLKVLAVVGDSLDLARLALESRP